MSHPFLTSHLARIHEAELLADAENARSGRGHAALTRRLSSLWRRRRGRAGPALVLVGPAAPSAQPARSAAGGDRAA